MKTREEAIAALRAIDARLCAWELDDGVADGDDPQSNVRWHTVALEGEWDGHWMGAFKVGREHLEQIVANFDGLKNDAVVDYEHATCLGPFVGKAPAAGWIDKMQVRDDSGVARLAARVRWTSTAATHIREKEYRYLSPVIAFRTPDRVTGQDLGASVPSVALTNTPFLDELPEVTLNSLQQLAANPPEHKEQVMNKEQSKALALSLGLPETATPEDILTAVESSQSDSTAMPRICKALGIDEGSCADDVIAAAEKINAAAASVPEGVDLAQLAKDAAEVRELRADARIDAAVKAGKVVASNRKWARDLALSDVKAFDAWEAAAPSIVPTSPVKPPQGGSHELSAVDVENPTDEEIKALAAKLPVEIKREAADFGLTAEDYAKANFAAFVAEYA